MFTYLSLQEFSLLFTCIFCSQLITFNLGSTMFKLWLTYQQDLLQSLPCFKNASLVSTKLSYTFDKLSSLSREKTFIALRFLFSKATFFASTFMLPVSASPTVSYKSSLFSSSSLSVFFIHASSSSHFPEVHIQQIIKSSSFIFLKHCYFLITSPKTLMNLI
ncbi:hypothetical protein AtEden1_Chr1g0058761 [Arabidopsis thaliana]